VSEVKARVALDQAVAARKEAVDAQKAKLIDEVNNAWVALDDTPCDAAESGSVVAGGVRLLYCEVSRYMDMNRLQELSDLKIFLQGPHGRVPNWKSNTFGHYNPKFVEWARDNLLPQKSDAPQKVYDAFMKRTARVYLITYVRLQKNPTELMNMADDYRRGSTSLKEGPAQLSYLESRYWESGIDEDPDIKKGLPPPNGAGKVLRGRPTLTCIAPRWASGRAGRWTERCRFSMTV